MLERLSCLIFSRVSIFSLELYVSRRMLDWGKFKAIWRLHVVLPLPATLSTMILRLFFRELITSCCSLEILGNILVKNKNVFKL